MEKFILGYEQPEIEIVEIAIEKGFASTTTVDPGGESEDGGWE